MKAKTASFELLPKCQPVDLDKLVAALLSIVDDLPESENNGLAKADRDYLFSLINKIRRIRWHSSLVVNESLPMV